MLAGSTVLSVVLPSKAVNFTVEVSWKSGMIISSRKSSPDSLSFIILRNRAQPGGKEGSVMSTGCLHPFRSTKILNFLAARRYETILNAKKQRDMKAI